MISAPCGTCKIRTFQPSKEDMLLVCLSVWNRFRFIETRFVEPGVKLISMLTVYSPHHIHFVYFLNFILESFGLFCLVFS